MSVFSWTVLNFNINTNTIELYDVLKYREDTIKKFKKQCGVDKNKFEDLLNTEMQCQYWSRAEYELILERTDNQLYLKPWVGSSKPEEAMILAIEDNTLDWVKFSKWNQLNWWNDKAKIDIYDQLKFRWDEFVDYCWTYRHKYERRRKDV